jgi:multisubunit Na+/H+ antiporter MnhB subunit
VAQAAPIPALAICLCVIGLYWLPVLIAWRRHVRNLGTIAVLTFFGFLVVTWIAALAWSVSDSARTPQPPAAEETSA